MLAVLWARTGLAFEAIDRSTA